jgi:all-trans-8'-apo-beta-carotenal 15,15'-oxygenase
MTAAPSLSPALQPSWRRAFVDLAQEHGFRPLRVEGRLPEGLVGTLYRTGPALFSAQGRPYQHWFDGDGAVSAVRFEGGTGAQGAVRLVQSEGLKQEREAGRALYGVYGTLAPGNPLTRRNRQKNVANTSVAVWQGRLLALMEGGRPTELSPADLSTLGETDLEGVVLRSFSAHPHYVPARRCAYNFTVRYGRTVQLELYALPDDGPARRMGSVPLSGSTMIHDFIATERHLVFFAPPLRLQLFRMLLGLSSFSDSLAWRPKLGTEVVVVPIDAPEKAVRYTVEPFYQWHFANAFERGEQVVVDYVRMPDFDTNRFLGQLLHRVPERPWNGTLHRAVLSPGKRTFHSEERWATSCEFPRVASASLARAHRHVFLAAYSSPAAARGLFDELARVDVETGEAERVSLGPDTWPSEPAFVRKPGATSEEEGWLLTLVYDAASHTSHVAVLDAQGLSRGPLARVHFDLALPFSFHGNWARG